MRLFDTHCHFEHTNDETVGAILRRAYQAGVTSLMAVGGSPALNAGALKAASLAQAAPDEMPQVYVALGFDREQVTLPERPEITVPDKAPLAAWGEIGLDYHYSPETRIEQRRLFAEQLVEAQKRHLPVSIHTREADDDTLGILREIPSAGIIHCFTGTPAFARQLLDLGFYVSFSGIVTFRAAENVRSSARYVPDDRLLFETDAPFLAPVPLRGETNEPAFITHTCAFLANVRACTPDQLAYVTTHNAEMLLCANRIKNEPCIG